MEASQFRRSHSGGIRRVCHAGVQAAPRSAWIRNSQPAIRFQLTTVWLTIRLAFVAPAARPTLATGLIVPIVPIARRTISAEPSPNRQGTLQTVRCRFVRQRVASCPSRVEPSVATRYIRIVSRSRIALCWSSCRSPLLMFTPSRSSAPPAANPDCKSASPPWSTPSSWPATMNRTRDRRR